MAWVSVVPRRAIFSQEINGRIGVYRNVFDVLVEYKQRCYRYEWPLDRSKDRFHWSSVFLCAIFHLVETEVTPSSIVAVDHHHHQTLSTEREIFFFILVLRNNGYEYDTASNMCKVFYYERKRGREKKENLNREFTLTRESSLRNFVSLYFKENKKRIKKIITLKKSWISI